MAKIYVDADACPVVIKEILYRAAQRTATETLFVANQPLRVPGSRYLKTLQVAAGFDVADNLIVQRVCADDLVITADIPLAAEVIAKGAAVFTPRGEQHSKENIGSRLNMRDFMDTLRSSGIQTGGPPPLNQADRQAFANLLDSWLAKK